MSQPEASIWQPRVQTQISGNTKSVEELITATEAQEVFTLLTFAYALGTGALEVHKNGLLLTKDVDWTEVSDSTFQLVVPAALGDKVVATGHVGITGDVDVRDTDIYLPNYQSLRDYAGTEVTVYLQGTVTKGDTGEKFFQLLTGAAPGFYVDDNVNTVVPTGGDGSSGWVSNADRLRIARSLNEAVGAVREVNYRGVLDAVKYLYDAVAQVIWGVPALDSAGETISTVVGDQLTTVGGAGGNTYTLVYLSSTLPVLTLQDGIDLKSLNVSDVVNVKELTTGSGGGSIWDVVLLASVTPDGVNIIQSVGDPSLALVLRKNNGEDRYFSNVAFTNGYRFIINQDVEVQEGQLVRVKNSTSDEELTSFITALTRNGTTTEIVIKDFNATPDIEYVIITPTLSNRLTRNRKSTSPFAKVGAGIQNLVVLGDSITEGVGATSFGNAYSFRMATGFSNKMYTDRGAVSYPAFYNMNNALDSGGVTTTGAILVDNTSSSSDVYVQLNPGQNITVNFRNFARLDFGYSDAAACDVSWYLNGALLDTKTLTDTVWDNTGKTWLNSLFLDETAPELELRCQTGTVRIRSLLFGSNIVAPVMHILGRSGRTFSNYTGQPVLESMYQNIADQGDGYGTTTMINMGTNSIYNVSSNESVDSYIQSLTDLIASCKSYDPTTEIVIGIPPQSNELVYPAIQDFYVNYIQAATEFCHSNGYEIVEYSDSLIEDNLADDLHPNDAGHSVMATLVADKIGSVSSGSVARWDEGFQRTITSTEIPLDSGWVGDGANGVPRVRSIDGITRITGSVILGVGTTDLIGTLPLGFRPLLTRRFVLEMGGDFIAVDVAPSGQINIIANPSSTPYNRVILNAISFEVF